MQWPGARYGLLNNAVFFVFPDLLLCGQLEEGLLIVGAAA
jgi:hypothetical protein